MFMYNGITRTMAHQTSKPGPNWIRRYFSIFGTFRWCAHRQPSTSLEGKSERQMYNADCRVLFSVTDKLTNIHIRRCCQSWAEQWACHERQWSVRVIDIVPMKYDECKRGAILMNGLEVARTRLTLTRSGAPKFDTATNVSLTTRTPQ